MQTQPNTRDRRRKGFVPQVARMTWPARRALDGALAGFPCNVLGHRMTEIPPSLRSARGRASGRLEFGCARCSMRAGFTS